MLQDYYYFFNDISIAPPYGANATWNIEHLQS